ncbi:hypothetical protein Scep_001788 [Stephania cephalantha]|uniref:Uncharacterized protein n=1 Tax=Stephania cephalantha TaxID=152367 RepID=A0AAP0Q3P7_9MAGN
MMHSSCSRREMSSSCNMRVECVSSAPWIPANLERTLLFLRKILPKEDLFQASDDFESWQILSSTETFYFRPFCTTSGHSG